MTSPTDSAEQTVITVDAFGTPRTRTVAPYDFKRPNKVNRDHARALQLVHETFARQFSTILSSTLRTLAPVTVTSIEQRTYDEYVRPLPSPTYMAILGVEPLAGKGILHLPLGAATEMIDRLLGGPGGASTIGRPLSEIEVGVLRGLLDRVVRELTYAFESFYEVDAAIVGTESNPQFAQIAAPSEMIVVANYSVGIADRTWEASMAFPFMMLQPALEAYTLSKQVRDVESHDLARAAEQLQGQLGGAPVDVDVAFSTVSLSAGEIVSLQPGDVLPLRHHTSTPLTVTVGGVPCFTAMPGRNGRRLAALVVEDLRAGTATHRPDPSTDPAR